MKFCANCGQKFESDLPKFCSSCGSKTTIQKKDDVSEDNDTSKEKENSANHQSNIDESIDKQIQVDKAVIITSEDVRQLKNDERQYQNYPVSVRTIQKPLERPSFLHKNIFLLAGIIIILSLIGGFLFYQNRQQKISKALAFQKELDDFRYEVETQWEFIVMNSNSFKEKCDNVFNKTSKDMSAEQKLHNYKTEAVAYRKSLETTKNTLDRIKMSNELQNYKNLDEFMDKLIVAINTNIDYCDNIVNLTGDPKNAKKEAQNKGQDTENAYMLIYRNEVFNKYFTMEMRINELDSIGGMIEQNATERAKELEVKKQPTNSQVVININGKPINNTGGSQTNINYSDNSGYHSQIKNILQRVVEARVEFGKIPQKFRSGQITETQFENFCQNAGRQRDYLLAEVQNIIGVPPNEIQRHQMIIQCLTAGSAACYNIAAELSKQGNGDWETVLKYISDYNTKNLDPILDYYQIY